MRFYPLHKLTATSAAILLNDLPLSKCAIEAFPESSLRHILRAQALFKQAESDEANPTPLLIRAHIHQALANPVVLGKGYHADEARVPSGQTGGGQWTSGNDGDSGQQYASAGNVASDARVDDGKKKPNKEGVTQADRENPRFKSMGDTDIKKQKFVDAHLASFEEGAKQLNVPVENLIAVSADESKWGISKAATQDNNFFGLHSPASFEIGSRPADGNQKVQFAQFKSFDDSMNSFIEDYGYLVRDTSDPTEFAQALQDSGAFAVNTRNGSKLPKYVSDIVSIVRHLPDIISSTRELRQ